VVQVVDREIISVLTDEQLIHYYGGRIGSSLVAGRLDHFVLTALFRYEKASRTLTLADLARFSGATRAGVMKSANRLEAIELITSRKYSGNKRYVRLNRKRPAWVAFVLGKVHQQTQETAVFVHGQPVASKRDGRSIRG
jgi:hypothetical protein